LGAHRRQDAANNEKTDHGIVCKAPSSPPLLAGAVRLITFLPPNPVRKV
jgi:hypothetical protein